MQINEIFCSLNGEGSFGGLRTVFVRTFACNLRCSWCDTVYAIEGNDYHHMSVDEIVAEVDKFNCKRVTLTGGEPLLQVDSTDLIKALIAKNYIVEIETNGAEDVKPVKDLKQDTVFLTMDWKCPSSGMTDKMLESNLGQLDRRDVIKCVVGSKEDLEEMNRVRTLTRAQMYVSPVFGQIELVDIANYILDNQLNDVRMQLQQHKIIWDPNTRGV